jgi:hypothetical protein
MRPTESCIAAALLVALAACAPAPDGSVDSAWGDATAVEELAIGVDVGADEYMFGRVESIAVAADETIYVSDAQATIVRVYDGDGNFVRNVGGEGQGPGEYGSAPGLGLLPDGRLVARDGGRVSLFSGDGEYLDSFPVEIGIARLLVDRDNSIYVPRWEGAVEVKYSLEGEELERVSMPPRAAEGPSFTVIRGINAFAVETHSALSPLGYLVTGRNDVYDIELHEPEGTIHLRRDLAPIPLAQEERAEWEALRQDFLDQARARNIPGVEIDPIPDVKPFFRDIHVGEDGRVWVWRHVAAEKRDDVAPLAERPEQPLLTWREPWTYDVFEPDGTFLGSVVVPERLRPFVFRGDRIWGSLIDDEGVERVVCLLVAPEAR